MIWYGCDSFFFGIYCFDFVYVFLCVIGIYVWINSFYGYVIMVIFVLRFGSVWVVDFGFVKCLKEGEDGFYFFCWYIWGVGDWILLNV